MKEYCYRVEAEDGYRIDLFLAEQMEHVSRSRIQKLIKDGNVSVNDLFVKQNHRLLLDDEVHIILPDLEMTNILAEEIPLHILYEDEDVLVVNKPKGMVVHPSAGHYAGTLVNALMYHCKDDLSGINGVLRPGIVHRIDKDTTGSLIVCKNDIAHQSIAMQLKNHSVNRIYHAIVHGELKEDTGTIEGTIGRHPADRKKMGMNVKNGKDAVTHYEVLKHFSKYTYIKCMLETGRTHQIRVHMAGIHHPLLGDTIYGPAKSPIKGLEGQCLHAKTLGFVHPRTGKYIEIDAPLPTYFTQLLEKLIES